MNVIIDGWAWLDRAALSPAQLHALRARLTIFPKQTSDIAGAKAPEPLLLFRDRPADGRFGVPRGFYRSNSTAAHAEELRVSYGQPMQPMRSLYSAEGPFAQQAQAIAHLQDQLTEHGWGGGILCAGCGCGKALAHGEPVLLRRGWTPIEEVRVDDEAAGTDGGFHRVTGVFPQGERDLFRVTFTDGTHVDCDGDHLWTLVKRRKREAPAVTMSTQDLAQETLRTAVGRLLWLPTMAPVKGVDGEMIFEPYTLGVLIGDGHFCESTGITVCTPDREIIDMMTVEPPNRVMEVKQSADHTPTYRFAPPIEFGQQEGSFKKRMRKLGMLGLTAHDKFIPENYENGSVATRIALLQGLFDTDGYASGGGAVEYTTVSDQIAHAVQRIVFALGGTCKLVKRQTRYTKNGEHSRWFDSFRLHIKLPADICPFRFSRKKEEFYRDGWQRKVGRAVESVTAIGRGQATCIAVDAPDHLYLTRNCVPTHNTVCAIELAHRIGRTALIVVHKEFFLDQWEQRIRDILPTARIGRIQQDICDIYEKDFVIAMVQSLVRNIEVPRYPKELADHFGIVITDEVHRVGAESWSKTVHSFNAAYRCGLSATVRRADGADPVFLGHIGPILHEMTADSMKPTLRVIPTGTRLQPIARGTYRVPVANLNSAQVINQLCADPWRTQVIAEDVARAARAGRKVMVVSHRLEHLREIKARVEAAVAAAPAAFPITCDAYTGQWFTGVGDAMKGRTRAELRAAEGANILLCTIQLVAEGLDISALDVIVLTTPLSDAEQAVGRVRRWCRPGGQCARYCPWRAATCPGKPAPVVVDVWDGEVALARRKGQARLKLYKRLGMAIPTPAATVQLALAPARPAHDPR